MPFDCQYRRQHGHEVCLTACAAADVTRTFLHARVDAATPPPPASDRIVDVALLDMHHGWPNFGHDALVHAIQTHVCDLRHELAARGMAIRVLSYDVRASGAIPDRPGGRHEIYVGTGGPGHLDPRLNDGRSPGSQGIDEDPSWERPLFALFDAIAADDTAALLGVCHTFGVMCRWLGVAEAVIRSPAKGGKSAGIVENVLTPPALAHPWFARFAARLPDGRRFPVLDSRLYDLIQTRSAGGVVALARETLGRGGAEGDGVTMIEVAGVAGATVPRIIGVNHHPEIVNRDRQLIVLQKKRDRGEVSDEWFNERRATLLQSIEDDAADRLLRLTSSYTLLAPLRAHVSRVVCLRAAQLGTPVPDDLETASLLYDPDADHVLAVDE